MWNEITSQSDAQNLLELFGYFHDGCIKELKYVSGAYVGSDMGMLPINEKRELSVIFQRQWRDPSIIEIIFSGLSQLHLAPVDENYTGDISSANLIYTDESIFWIDEGGITEQELRKQEDPLIYTRIKANSAKWRVVEEFIGEDDVLVYSK